MRDYNLKLDIMDSEINIDELWFIKGDSGGYITLELTDNQEIIDLSNSSVIAIFEKKDKTITQKEATIVDLENSKVQVDMINSIIDVPGKVKCFIKIYKGESVTTFSPFNITVKKSISMDDVVESYTELDILQIVNRNTEEIENLSKDLENLSNAANEEFDNLNTNILNLEENLNNEIKLINEDIDNLYKETKKTIEDLSNDINNSLNPIKKDIKNIQDNKVDIIISSEEPDYSNLKLGTIWIKPLVENE